MTPDPLMLYGTLRDPDILSAVLGRTVNPANLRAASAPFYRTVYYPGQVYPALIDASQGAAEGLLLEQLSAGDLEALDAFEGEEYRRQAITVSCEGKPIPAQAYLPLTPIAATAPAWSLAHWTATHKPNILAVEVATAAALRPGLSAKPPL